MSLKSFYNQRYSLKLNNNIHRIKEIRIIDNLYYYKFIKNELKKCKCKGKNIIDIGCGIADHLKYLEKNSIAIDISEIALSNCNVNNRIVADVTYLPIKSGSIDITLCIEMIEHLKIGDQVKAIAEICRISNHNRLILISVPNESFHTCIICRIVNKLFKDSGHIGSFNKEKLFNLLNIQGFNNIKIYTHGFFSLGILLFFERSLFLKKLIKKTKPVLKKMKIDRLIINFLFYETKILNHFFEGFRLVVVVR